MSRGFGSSLYIFLFLFFGFFSRQLGASVFTGQVVDAETGEPLEGAVVAVVWYRYPVIYLMDPVPVFHQAVEAVSDASGKFSIDTSYASFPFRFESRNTVVFKPGYRPILNYLSAYNDSRPVFQARQLKMVKIKAMQEMMKFTTAGDLKFSTCYPESSSYCVPESRIKNLLHVLRLQRRILGVEYEGNVIR